MTTKYRTQIVFWTAAFLSVVAIGLTLLRGNPFLILLALSAAYNLWSIIKSERDGFVKSSHLRRAYEPARHFGPTQTFIVVGLIMLELCVAAYTILA